MDDHELDEDIREAVAHAASSLQLGSNGQFLEKWLDQAVVEGIQRHLGSEHEPRLRGRRAALPDWDPMPGAFEGGSSTESEECLEPPSSAKCRRSVRRFGTFTS